MGNWRADQDAGALVWLFLVVIWAIVQFIAKAIRKPQGGSHGEPIPPPARDPGSELDEFMEMLRKAAGAPAAKPAQRPPPPPPPAPAPAVAAVRPSQRREKPAPASRPPRAPAAAPRSAAPRPDAQPGPEPAPSGPTGRTPRPARSPRRSSLADRGFEPRRAFVFAEIVAPPMALRSQPPGARPGSASW